MLTTKKLLILSLVLLIFSARPALAYDSHFAHRQLVERTVALWQESEGVSLSQEQIDWLVDGAEQEDYPVTRTLNHFYDPSTGRGLTLMGVQLGQASPDWARDADNQGSGWGGDFSWPTGVAAMKAGDEKLAWLALGHNLHLLADLASPAHTHNDDHAEGDPYEAHIKHWLRDGSGNFEQLGVAQTETSCANLTDCLEFMATYTNSHTFSKDWALVRDLPVGTKVSADGKFYLENKLIGKKVVGKYDVLSEKVVLDSEVLDAYLQALAPLVLSYGQGMIRAYIKESTKEFTKNELLPTVDNAEVVRAIEEPRSVKKPIRITIPSIAIIDIKKPDLSVVPTLKKVQEVVNSDLKFDWPLVDESIGIPQEYLKNSLWPAIMSGGALPASAAGLDESDLIEVAPIESIPPSNNQNSSTPPIVIENPPQVEVPPIVDTAPSSSPPGLPPVSETEVSSTPPLLEVVPNASFVNMPTQYSQYLDIAWQASPFGLWRYDLSFSYDDGPSQILVKGELLNYYKFAPSEAHNILKLDLVGRLPDGTRVGTSTEIYFVPSE